jgi:thioredoxin 1
MTTKATERNWQDEVIGSDEPVLVDFYADWCGPCRMAEPLVEKIDEDNDWLKVVKVDVDNSGELSFNNSVRSVPTFIVFDHGEEIGRSVGYHKDKLDSIVKKVHRGRSNDRS